MVGLGKQQQPLASSEPQMYYNYDGEKADAPAHS